MVPVLLNAWGKQRYGEWQTLAAAATYLGFLDFGVQSYVVNRMTQAHATRNMREFARHLNAGLWLSAIASGCALALVAPAIWVAPLRSWFHLAITTRTDAAAVALVLAMYTATGIPASMLCGVYRATNEYARGLAVDNVYRIAQIASTVAIVFCGGGLLPVALSQFAALWLYIAFVWRDISKRKRYIGFRLQWPDLKLAQTFLGPSSLFFAMQFAAVMSFQGGTLVVARMAGSAGVALFVTSRTLVNGIKQVMNLLTGTLWPEFTELEARGDYRTLRLAHELTTKVLLALSMIGITCLHFLSRDVLRWWTHDRIGYEAGLVNAFLLLELLQDWYQGSWVLLASSNRQSVLAWCSMVSSCAGLALGIALYQRFGVAGIVVGFLLTDLATSSYFVPQRACALLGRSFAGFVGRIMVPGAAMLGLLYLAMLFISRAIVGWAFVGRSLAICSGSALIAGVFLYCGWLSRPERELLRQAAAAWRHSRAEAG